MIEGLKEERHILGLLKHIFWAEPTKEFLQDIEKISIIPEEEDDTDRGLNLMIYTVKRNKDCLDEYVEELAVEFARLFIGPRNPSAIPYASFYLSESKTVMSNVTIDVRKRYLEAGMAVKELYSFPDDHIAIELEFLQYLAERIIELFEKGERVEASKLFEVRENFLREHLSNWATEFADNIIDSTNDEFYHGAALILKGCVCCLK